MGHIDIWVIIVFSTPVFICSMSFAIAGLIIGFHIAPRWRKTGALTAAQFITERLGYKTQKVDTYLFLFISIFTTVFFLYPVAKIVAVLGLLILVYTAVGGLWAVIVKDVLQFVVLTAAVFILVPLSFNAIGGIDEFVTGAPEGFSSLVSGEYSWEFVIAFGFYNFPFLCVSPIFNPKISKNYEKKT
ncbi:MAG: hypothetical protein ACFCUM_09620 [Bacteroidales bacterium]